ncbi:ABC transporter substrate-binding protein [Kutzneria viridogrisea]|uniref:Oligopeptide transport system substrate-binding protein n=1 Tax=Kutzneria viridogrisea TaxID=47990 RepID=A0ABR6BZJ5_9PSEU|nr:oligopeptide transport system substrate-binding protein [Kutzneria viridogrisea]
MRLRVLAAPVLALLLLSGCTSAASQPGVLTAGLREPATLLPAEVRDQAGRLVTSALWTPLADYDPASGKLTPRSAESITSTDQVHWVVRLRPGGRFHDGTPVTAKSYVDTWQAISASHWATAGLLADTLRAKEITAPDDTTIALTLERPFGQVPAVLSAPGLVPLPASVLTSHDWAGFARQPVGNGPFRLTAPWRPGQGGTLVRVADVPGKAHEVDLRVGDPSAQYDQVKAGELDLATEVPGDRHGAMHTDFPDRHAMWALPEATYLAFPVADKRFEDPTVRHGFALAVDRAKLAAGPLGSQVDPARGVLPPADSPGPAGDACRACVFDGAAAKALVSQSGFTGAATVRVAAGDQVWAKPMGEQVHGVLGVPVTIADADGPFALTVSLASPSPHELFAAIAKATGYADEGFADLLAAADGAGSPEELGRACRVVEAQLVRDLPAVPLWTAHGHAVWSERLHDVAATPFGGIGLAGVSVA